MIQSVLFLVLGAILGVNANACGGELTLGDVDSKRELQEFATKPSDGGLQARQLDGSRLIVSTTRETPHELSLNGGSGSYPWRSFGGGSYIVLEGCSFDRSALSASSGDMRLKWIGERFFSSRPAIENEASSLQQFSYMSQALGEKREIYLVASSGWDGSEGDPLIVSGDGLAGGAFGAIVETISSGPDVGPIAFASARFGEGLVTEAKVPRRSAEYHTPPDAAHSTRRSAYRNHQIFFFEEFIPFVLDRLGASNPPIYMFGVSSSGTFALEQGLKRPESIAGIIAGSPPIHTSSISLARQAGGEQAIHIWCGEFEDVLCEPIKELAKDLDFSLETRFSSHMSALWEEGFSHSLSELFYVEGSN